MNGSVVSEFNTSPFPPLGSAQRPSMIRLADGNLFFTSDAYLHKLMRPPPAGWRLPCRTTLVWRKRILTGWTA